LRLTDEIRYAADPDAVFAMLSDPDFQDSKCRATGALEHSVEVEPDDDGGVTITTSRSMPTDQLPDFLRGLTGGTLTVVQVETWDPPDGDGGREGTIEVEISGAPVSMHGTLRLAPDGTGDGARTVETIDGELKAKVPLIGGRIEKAAEPAVRAAVRAERRTGTAWLAGER
jgi:hypothetical protein